MSIAIDSSTSGMIALDLAIDTIANDLANANTTGYKRKDLVFSDLAYNNINKNVKYDDSSPYIKPMQIGLGTKVSDVSTIHEQGALNNTGLPLDIAIVGLGYFEITLPDGNTRYTRSGHFRKNSNGDMVTTQGYELADGISIPDDIINIKITQDGIVRGSNDLFEETELGQIQLSTFNNPAGLQEMGEGLYIETVDSGSPNVFVPGEEIAGTLEQGFLENSNVNIISLMTSMMKVHRTFDYCLKCLYTSHEMLKSIFASNNKIS